MKQLWLIALDWHTLVRSLGRDQGRASCDGARRNSQEQRFEREKANYRVEMIMKAYSSDNGMETCPDCDLMIEINESELLFCP